MASPKVKRWFASQGIALSHTGTECGNFATGTGTGEFALPYHIVSVDSRYGTSKQTVGWAKTKADGLKQRQALEDAEYHNETQSTGRGGGEYHERTVSFYVIDIRTNEYVY